MKVNCRFTIGTTKPVSFFRFDTLKEYVKIVAERVGLVLITSSAEEVKDGGELPKTEHSGHNGDSPGPVV